MLYVEDDNNIPSLASEDPKVASPSPPPSRGPRIPNWERRLPKRLVVASTASQLSLELRVELQTPDTGEICQLDALVDCGATGTFINEAFVKEKGWNTQSLMRPIPVNNVDGTPNEAGMIRSVVNLILRYKDHTERTTFFVTNIGSAKVILGYSWLKDHNPEVDWQTKEVRMSRCPAKCKQCQSEVRSERNVRRAEVRRLNTFRKTPRPTVADCEDDDDLAPQPEDEDDESEDFPLPELEEGDRIIATVVHSEEQQLRAAKAESAFRQWQTERARQEEIRASSTIAQRLAEGFAKNSGTPAKGFREIVPAYLHDFEGVFAKTSFDTLPSRRAWDHTIELVPDASPKSCKIYPLSPSEQDELDAFLAENLRTGRIRPSKSPMASPVFFIKKKDGTLRLVQDYRALNAMTIKNRYPLPLIPDLIRQLRDAKYFTKLDVRWGYNNVRIKHGDEWKAAFRTTRGLFEPLVMFFGLTNSPSTFQAMMNDIFSDLVAEGVVCVYLDDILIYTKSREEHRRVLRVVLERLQAHKLFLKPEKCEFERERIEYLGLIISKGKVEMDPVKVAGVAEWPAPRNKKEVQSFLRFTNFYRRFIANFSHMARPLFDLTAKDVKWGWGSTEQIAFDSLKNAITSTPILVSPDDNRPFRVEADSSDFATGAVLSQQSPIDDKWHPIAFYSKSLNAVERNYEIHDKEMLAIIRALEEWRHFLEGAKHQFEIWTDHKNLEYFMKARKLNRR